MYQVVSKEVADKFPQFTYPFAKNFFQVKYIIEYLKNGTEFKPCSFFNESFDDEEYFFIIESKYLSKLGKLFYL